MTTEEPGSRKKLRHGGLPTKAVACGPTPLAGSLIEASWASAPIVAPLGGMSAGVAEGR